MWELSQFFILHLPTCNLKEKDKDREMDREQKLEEQESSLSPCRCYCVESSPKTSVLQTGHFWKEQGKLMTYTRPKKGANCIETWIQCGFQNVFN